MSQTGKRLLIRLLRPCASGTGHTSRASDVTEGLVVMTQSSDYECARSRLKYENTQLQAATSENPRVTTYSKVNYPISRGRKPQQGRANAHKNCDDFSVERQTNAGGIGSTSSVNVGCKRSCCEYFKYSGNQCPLFDANVKLEGSC